MADNPIKYSDFIAPDGSVNDLIAQLTKLQKVYSDMLVKLRTEAGKLEVTLTRTNSATTAGQAATRKAATDADKLAKEYEKLEQAKSDTTKEIIKLRAEQRDLNTVTKLTEKLNNSAKGSFNALSAQYALNKITLNKLSEEQRKGTKAGRELEASTKALYVAMDSMQVATGDHRMRVGQYERALQGLPGPLAGAASGIMGMVSAARALIATPVGWVLAGLSAVASIFAKTTQVAIPFEAQMDKVAAVTDASGEELAALAQDAKNLGANSSKTATEVGSLQEELAKLGFTTSEILDASGAVLTLSEATGGDLAEGAAIAASTIRGFGMDAAETNRVVDVMAQGFNKSALDLEYFKVAMSQVAPVAKVNNISLEESTAMLGVLADAGLSASVAGTSLRSNLIELSTKGLTLTEALDKIANAQDKTKEAFKLFGKEGSVAGLILADNKDRIQGLTTALEDSEGAASKMAAVMKDNLQGDITRLSSAWEALFLNIDDGNGVISRLSRFFVQSLTKLLTWFMNFKDGFVKGWNELIAGSTLFRVAVAQIEGSFRIVFGSLFTILKTFGKVLVETAGILKSALIGDFEGAKRGFNNIKNAYVDGFQAIKNSAAEARENVVNAFTGKDLDRYTIKTSTPKVRKTAGDPGTTDPEEFDPESRSEGGIPGTTRATKATKASTADTAKAVDIEKEKQDLLLAVMSEGQAKELAILEKNYTEKKALFERFGLDMASLEGWRNTETAKITEKYADAARQKQAEDMKKQYDAQLLVIDQAYELRLSEIDIMKATEAEKTKLRLQAERQRLQKLIQLNQDSGAQLTEVQVQVMRNTVKKIEQELLDLASSTEPMDIYEMLGIDLKEGQKQALADSFNFIKANIQELLALRVQAADIAVKKIEEEGKALQKRFEQEVEARNNGFANQAVQVQREIELNKQKEQQALKEKEKAQKAASALDTVTQISSLVTASTQIWKSLAGIPVVGTILAIAAVGTMFASYAASKLKARSVAKQKYGEGGLEILQGGSHASGNDIPIGTTPDGRQRTAEGGEAMGIVRKTSTRKYKSLLPSIFKTLNNGTFERYFGVQASGGIVVNNAPGYDFAGMAGDINVMRRNGELRTYTDSRGRTVEIYKNLKRTYV